MIPKNKPFLICLLLLWALALGSHALARHKQLIKLPKDPSAKLLFLLDHTIKTVEAADSYTALFDKNEWVSGKQQPDQTIFYKFKKPFKVYMHWLTGYPGQELIYSEGENNNKIIGHPDGAMAWYVAVLDPHGKTAMKGNRYPVTSSGLANLARLVRKNWVLAQTQNHPQIQWQSLSPAAAGDMATIEFHFTQPNDTDADLCRAWFNRDGLLYQLEIERPAGKQVGHYAYRDLKLNAHLSDQDFSRTNKEYHLK